MSILSSTKSGLEFYKDKLIENLLQFHSTQCFDLLYKEQVHLEPYNGKFIVRIDNETYKYGKNTITIDERMPLNIAEKLYGISYYDAEQEKIAKKEGFKPNYGAFTNLSYLNFKSENSNFLPKKVNNTLSLIDCEIDRLSDMPVGSNSIGIYDFALYGQKNYPNLIFKTHLTNTSKGNVIGSIRDIYVRNFETSLEVRTYDITGDECYVFPTLVCTLDKMRNITVDGKMFITPNMLGSALFFNEEELVLDKDFVKHKMHIPESFVLSIECKEILDDFFAHNNVKLENVYVKYYFGKSKSCAESLMTQYKLEILPNGKYRATKFSSNKDIIKYMPWT